MPDLDIIEKHLFSFLHDFENLKKHKNVTLEDVKSDTDLLWILERGLYLLIQNLFDMLAHITSADFSESWDFYADIPDVLAKHKVITEEDQILLAGRAGQSIKRERY